MSRLIAVSEEVYDELSERKEGRSFTETIKDLLEEKKRRRGTLKEVEKLFGIIGKKEADRLRKASGESRRNFKPRDFGIRRQHGST